MLSGVEASQYFLTMSLVLTIKNIKLLRLIKSISEIFYKIIAVI